MNRPRCLLCRRVARWVTVQGRGFCCEHGAELAPYAALYPIEAKLVTSRGNELPLGEPHRVTSFHI